MNKGNQSGIVKSSSFNEVSFLKTFLIPSIWLLFNIFYPEITNGQKIDYTNNFAEKLVTLALANNPDQLALIDKVQANAYLLKIKKISILNSLVLSLNLNEFSFNNNLTNNNYYIPIYPKYNIGLTIPFGLFFTTPKEVRIASKQYDYQLDLVYSKREDIRNKVLNHYQLFLSNRELLSMSSKNFQESRAIFLKREKDFQSGTSSFSDYSKAKSTFISDMIQNLRFKHDYYVSKYDLEKLIGIRMEDLSSN